MPFRKLREGSLIGNYGIEACQGMLRHLKDKADVRGKRALVIGSINPWVEASLLEAGAGHITTLEYQKFRSYHPNITVVQPDAFTKDYLAGKMEQCRMTHSYCAELTATVATAEFTQGPGMLSPALAQFLQLLQLLFRE